MTTKEKKNKAKIRSGVCCNGIERTDERTSSMQWSKNWISGSSSSSRASMKPVNSCDWRNCNTNGLLPGGCSVRKPLMSNCAVGGVSPPSQCSAASQKRALLQLSERRGYTRTVSDRSARFIDVIDMDDIKSKKTPVKHKKKNQVVVEGQTIRGGLGGRPFRSGLLPPIVRRRRCHAYQLTRVHLWLGLRLNSKV